MRQIQITVQVPDEYEDCDTEIIVEDMLRQVDKGFWVITDIKEVE